MPTSRILRTVLLVLALAATADAFGLDAPLPQEPRRTTPAAASKPSSSLPTSATPLPLALVTGASAAPATVPPSPDPQAAVAAPLLKPKPAAVPNPVKVSSDPRPALDPGTFINTLRAVERHLALAEAGGWPALPTGTTRAAIAARSSRSFDGVSASARICRPTMPPSATPSTRRCSRR
jgi:hypothetical protein